MTPSRQEVLRACNQQQRVIPSGLPMRATSEKISRLLRLDAKNVAYE